MSRGARTAARIRGTVDACLWVFIAVVMGAVLLSQVLPRLGHAVFIVGGPSMEPALPVGSVVLTTPTEDHDLRVADVVTMRIGPDHAIFTHRIIRIVERDGGVWLETKGDSNAEADPAIVPATAVIGRVEFVLPAVGYLIALLSMPAGVLFAIGLAATLFMLAWLLELFEDDAREPLRQTIRTIARRTRVVARSQVHPDLFGRGRSGPGGIQPPLGSASG